MMKKNKRPVSILLVFMMLVSLFTAVPVTAGAATVYGLNELSAGMTLDDVKDSINGLPGAKDVTLNDKAAVEAARTAYDALDGTEKAKIDADTLKKLTDAEKKIADLEAVKAVEDMIKALPAVETITYADKDVCKAANDAYNELTAEQIGLLDDDLFNKLCDAMDVIYDIEAAMAVEALIEALPEKITSENMAQFEEVFDAHFELTANQVEYISQENESKYDAAANARGSIIGPIERLPENITLADKAAVDSLKEQYDKAHRRQEADAGCQRRLSVAPEEKRNHEKSS